MKYCYVCNMSKEIKLNPCRVSNFKQTHQMVDFVYLNTGKDLKIWKTSTIIINLTLISRF